MTTVPCADLEGGGRGGPDPPWNLQSLTSPILLEMKKLAIFHICALPQLYVKVGPPPWKNFLDPRLYLYNNVDLSDNFVAICITLTGQEHVFKIYFLTKE